RTTPVPTPRFRQPAISHFCRFPLENRTPMRRARLLFLLLLSPLAALQAQTAPPDRPSASPQQQSALATPRPNQSVPPGTAPPPVPTPAGPPLPGEDTGGS